MVFILFLYFLKIILGNNYINFYQLKKINKNLRKIAAPPGFDWNLNIIIITIVNNDKIEKEINFISDFCTTNFITYDEENLSKISLEPKETIEISIFFPDDFNGSCEKMFYGIKDVTKIEFYNFTGCISTDLMFANCSSLKTLVFHQFDTINIDSMNYMFSGCSSLENLDLTNFNTSNVKSMDGMFNECSSLKSLDLSSFNTSSVESMNNMFKDSMNLDSLILSSNFTMNNIKNEIDYENFISNSCMKITYNGADILNKIKEKLQECNVIEIKIKSNHNGQMDFINYFSAKYDNNNFIENNSYQIKIYVNDEEMTDMKKNIEVYKNEQYIIKIKYPLDFNDYCDGMFKGIEQIEYVKFYNFKGCKSTIQMFKECSLLETLNLSLFNFSQVSDMTEMFSNSKKFFSILHFFIKL